MIDRACSASTYDEHQRRRGADADGGPSGRRAARRARALARRLRRGQRPAVAASATAPLLPVAFRRRAAPTPPRGSLTAHSPPAAPPCLLRGRSPGG